MSSCRVSAGEDKEENVALLIKEALESAAI